MTADRNCRASVLVPKAFGVHRNALQFVTSAAGHSTRRRACSPPALELASYRWTRAWSRPWRRCSPRRVGRCRRRSCSRRRRHRSCSCCRSCSSRCRRRRGCSSCRRGCCSRGCWSWGTSRCGRRGRSERSGRSRGGSSRCDRLSDWREHAGSGERLGGAGQRCRRDGSGTGPVALVSGRAGRIRRSGHRAA